MSERFKYTLNGVYRCRNLALCLEDGFFPEFRLGPALGLDRWKIGFHTIVENGKQYIYPAIHNSLQPKNIRVRAHFNIPKKDESSGFKTEISNFCMNSDQVCNGQDMDLEELLDEKNGYLDDGALSFEYGFQVDSEEGHDGIWRFNFSDEFFGSEDKDIIYEFDFRMDDSLFGHKQIVKLHSKVITEDTDWVQSSLLNQIESLKQLSDILKELDLGKMSPEPMKQFVKKYLDLIE